MSRVALVIKLTQSSLNHQPLTCSFSKRHFPPNPCLFVALRKNGLYDEILRRYPALQKHHLDPFFSNSIHIMASIVGGMTGALQGTLTGVLNQGQGLLDRFFPPERREELYARATKFATEQPAFAVSVYP